jgi:Helix-turn-helix.
VDDMSLETTLMTRDDAVPNATETGAVAALIQYASAHYGVSYREIESRSGISKASISNYARGRIETLPKHARLVALARALRVPLPVLLHAFLVDLGLDILGQTSGTVEEAVREADWLTDDERDLLLRQITMFRQTRQNRP